jgi:hypothetical protein
MMRFRIKMAGMGFQLGVLATAGVLVFCGQAWSAVNGGPGGQPFRVICPPGTFVKGLTGKAGNIIENMQLLCAGFDKAGNNFVTKPPFPQGSIIGAGQGGNDVKQECGPPIFVKEIRYNTRVFNDFTLIESIRLECRDLELGTSTHLFGNVETSQGQFIERCPGREFLVGLEGRVGLFVDAVGPVCAVMP